MEERHMCTARKPGRVRPRAKGLIDSMRDFLTSGLFKQVRKTASRRKMPRWDLHPLLYILLMTTWCCGDSLPERFEAARAFYVACCPKRKRPGETFVGFEKAVSKLPICVFRVVASALRGRIAALFGDRLKLGEFIPFGCDGTRQACPRTEELERRLGTFGKDGSPPMLWNTCIVHLRLGFPWCWRFGKGGKASERQHLVSMLKWLPKCALLVADAGYVGYDLVRELIAKNVSFLIRMSSNATFYIDKDGMRPADWSEGVVYYWPKTIRNDGKPPIRGRFICVCGRKRKTDVWLFTNVEDQRRLSWEMAGQFYRWRWENEGFFRTYKHTMKMLKMTSRTLRLAHREAEASMLATQLLLVQGALAMPKPSVAGELPAMCSPRKVLLEVRREITGRVLSRIPFGNRLVGAARERRQRTTPKQKREWPRRKTHKPPKGFKGSGVFKLKELTSNICKYGFDQTWTLDGLGNFSEFDDDGLRKPAPSTKPTKSSRSAAHGWTRPTTSPAI